MDAPTIEQMELEITWLETFGELVVSYAMKLVAHHDETPPAEMPTLGDIDAFIDYAEGLIKKYIVLIKGIDAEFHVIFNYDWLRPLTYPWLDTKQAVVPVTPGWSPCEGHARKFLKMRSRRRSPTAVRRVQIPHALPTWRAPEKLGARRAPPFQDSRILATRH